MATIDDIIRRSIKDHDEDNEIDEADIFIIIEKLMSPAVGVRTVKHLKLLELDDFPPYLSVIQKRILLTAFRSIDSTADVTPNKERGSVSTNKESSDENKEVTSNQSMINSFDEIHTDNDGSSISIREDEEIQVDGTADAGDPANSDCNSFDGSEELREYKFCYSEDFSKIKEFFAEHEWESYSSLEKKRFLNLYHQYNRMIDAGYDMPKPCFMEKKEEPKKRKPATQEKTIAQPSRKSSRLEGRTTSVIYCDDASEDSESCFELTAEQSKQAMSPKTPPMEPGSSNHGPLQTIKRNEQPTKKIIRLFGQKLVYPTPLPSFSTVALTNLKKPAHLRNMNPILSESKAFLIAHTRGKYIGKSEYDAFSQTMVEKYPKLRCEDSRCAWWRFKKSLSASFREQRARDKRKEEKLQKSKREAIMAGHGLVETNTPAISPDENIEALKKATDKREIARLLQVTAETRQAFYCKLTAGEIHEQFQHLKQPEMLLLDYITLTRANYETLESNFQAQLDLVGKHFSINISTEGGKMKAINAVHDYFLAAAVKKGAKAVFHLVDEQNVYQAVQSSDIQAPFMVAYLKDSPFTTEKEMLKSVSICTQGRIVTAMNKEPQAIKSAIMLLGSYFVFGIEYPRPYMEFLRAVERFATGATAPSVYGQTKVKYQKFMSLIKSKPQK